ncbi:hypothetical protein [Kutzneria albida]|uniref:Uncharacterized protein n=1 Tax=Kutzneria albida DSM 43870 TaxID=1449976 RepID=W5WCN4_9PSEU|nr:hypothetical protein [Kutzneria albida]AHH98311.1 hypothetical protein KALB_4949 [Kutzneria albida DSM 43870]
MPQPPATGAHIEIIEPNGPASGPLLPGHVYINGVDVGLIAEDGIQIKAGDAGKSAFTAVTLTLYPRLLEIKSSTDEEKQ